MAFISNNKNKILSVFGLVMINVIAIDSLRNLPTNAGMGIHIVLFYTLATLFFMIPCALIIAELATHRPQTGGVYVWVRDAFGPRWGFINIWLQWIYNVVWYPTILSFIAANIAYLIDPLLVNQKTFIVPMVIAMFTLATVINSFGMRFSSWVSTIGAIIGTLIPMFFIIGLGITWYWLGKPLAVQPETYQFADLSSIRNVGFLVVVLFSLMGLEMSAVHAESVKDPHRDFPKALLISTIIIVSTLLLASLAIAIVVPQGALNIISGLDQAYSIFLKAFHLEWLMPIIVLLIIIGAFCGMSAWVIGPTKGLMVAADDRCAPQFFSMRNKSDSPLVILFTQWIIVLALCSLFFFFKFVSTSYWILSDLTSQLALIFYILFFAAAIRLRYKTPRNPKAFRIPGGNWVIWILGIIGILTCLFAIFVGFIPPEDVHVGNIWVYELILVFGIIFFSVPPFIIYQLQKNKCALESNFNEDAKT